MCADTKRLFFKSNKHWREGITEFVELINNMIYKGSTSDERTVFADTLFKENEGLLRSIAQWAFWKNRPDIEKVLEAEDLGYITGIGRQITESTIKTAANIQESGNGKIVLRKGGMKLLEIIATTPAFSKEYDPHCTVSYVSGFIQRLISDADCVNKGVIDTNVKALNLTLLQLLTKEACCIDKEVITGMISLGFSYVDDYPNAELLMSILYALVLQESDNGKGIPNDTRVAWAIRSGLIELCMNNIEQFGSFGIQEFMYNSIKFIITTVHAISLHQKTAKAIKHKRSSIEEQLFRLDEDGDMSDELLDMVNFCSKLGITNDATANPKIKDLLDMVRSILSLNGSYCCQCNKSLSRTEAMECNVCGHMTYCSLACQRKDWSNGHNLSCKCKGPCAHESIGLYQGRIHSRTLLESERANAKMKDLEINMNMIQLKLFLDNAEDILLQAKALELPLYDCVVRFDLRDCPPTIKVHDYRENF